MPRCENAFNAQASMASSCVTFQPDRRPNRAHPQANEIERSANVPVFRAAPRKRRLPQAGRRRIRTRRHSIFRGRGDKFRRRSFQGDNLKPSLADEWQIRVAFSSPCANRNQSPALSRWSFNPAVLLDMSAILTDFSMRSSAQLESRTSPFLVNVPARWAAWHWSRRAGLPHQRSFAAIGSAYRLP
jgi:hypothetical protein